ERLPRCRGMPQGVVRRTLGSGLIARGAVPGCPRQCALRAIEHRAAPCEPAVVCLQPRTGSGELARIECERRRKALHLLADEEERSPGLCRRPARQDCPDPCPCGLRLAAQSRAGSEDIADQCREATVAHVEPWGNGGDFVPSSCHEEGGQPAERG